ncbi:MAG: RraA family protein, partial [Alphaproteobacteria bacterium]|nr:RraA family protein [Alphaproteobacteria bacterium]
MSIGFEIHPSPARPATALLEEFRTVVTPHLSD